MPTIYISDILAAYEEHREYVTETETDFDFFIEDEN